MRTEPAFPVARVDAIAAAGAIRPDSPSFIDLANTLRQVISLENAKHRRWQREISRQPADHAPLAFSLDFVEQRIEHLRQAAALLHALAVGGHEDTVKKLAAKTP